MIDILEALRLAFDTGVLTLIWLVQLVIYPSLTKYSEYNLKSWHPIYTRRVTYVVLPLMIGQLGLSGYHVMVEGRLSDIAHLILILAAWAITFFKAVPLHQSLDSSEGGIETARELININKTRTLMWTLTWVLSIAMVLV